MCLPGLVKAFFKGAFLATGASVAYIRRLGKLRAGFLFEVLAHAVARGAHAAFAAALLALPRG